jgi:hypothetical protein
VQLAIVPLLHLFDNIYFVFCVVCWLVQTENFAAIRYPLSIPHSPCVCHKCIWHVTLTPDMYVTCHKLHRINCQLLSNMRVVKPAHLLISPHACMCHVACFTYACMCYVPCAVLLCCCAARYLSMISECSLLTNYELLTLTLHKQISWFAHVTAVTYIYNLTMMQIAIQSCTCNLML